MSFLNRRVGFDLFLLQIKHQPDKYSIINFDRIRPALLNAGTIENKGVEVQFNATPFKTTDFQWDLNLNWSQNKSLVVELLNGIENLQLAFTRWYFDQRNTWTTFYGTIRGSDYIYADNGQPIVNQTEAQVELVLTKELQQVTM
jgi:hypothetical protein